MSDSESDANYFKEVVAEIEAEAQRRSSSGEYPRALLRSLDEEFRRWIPDASLENGVEDTIRSIEAAAYVDPAVPVNSKSPAGRLVKWAVRRLTYFYHRHVTQQITALGIHITRPLRLLDANLKGVNRRLAALEDRLDVGTTARSELLAGITISSPFDDFNGVLNQHFNQVSGRVLIGDLPSVELLSALRNEGIDAYGVTSSDTPMQDTVDVRHERLFDHLGDLQNESLGGFILCGITDHGSVNEQLRALRLMLLRSKPGAAMAVIVLNPETWGERLSPVAADLLHGRPMHAETWNYLVAREGASNIRVTQSSDSYYYLITANLL
ncbi:MAG TPA: hypothetical protein DCX77_09025 [Acidimicrobiaceae bacterium]|nr:hypothetical protein [Acidimicrobiaceae bacterium]|tara:strand:+ start:167 stop:1141 length:975 start_codon:yes stop_codon:yes gene_type:complete